MILVVLVRRIARPVSGRREHLHDEETLRGKLRLDDVVDLPCRVARSTHLDFHVLGRNETRLELFVCECAAHCDFDVADC